MKISQRGIELIKHFEGFREKVYICPAGIETIGYGHAIKPGESFDEITQGEAEEILRHDIEWAETAVNNFVSVSINQNQFDALVSFVFNVGSGQFQHSTLLKVLNLGNYEKAATSLLAWKYAGGKIITGLEKRRHEEKRLFEEPEELEAA